MDSLMIGSMLCAALSAGMAAAIVCQAGMLLLDRWLRRQRPVMVVRAEGPDDAAVRVIGVVMMSGAYRSDRLSVVRFGAGWQAQFSREGDVPMMVRAETLGLLHAALMDQHGTLWF